MNNSYKNKIAITTGDINGIGTEITVKALNELNIAADKVVLITNKNSLKLYPELKNDYEIIDIEYNSKIEYGKPTKASGEFSFNCLKTACQIRPKAIVTAPVSKEALHLAGHKFNGQTEVLEHYLAVSGQKAEMLFVSDGLNVLLLTRHCALKDIVITKEMIADKIVRLNNFFVKHYNITAPKLALCSLNPHAGEGGILGTEEIKIIIPAVNELRKNGVNITMPLPSDTLFIEAAKNYYRGQKSPYDCYIAMYHDQGLIPVKTIAAEKTVNMTIGLDIIRTSPSHGTAFDIAGKNIANPISMIEAVRQVLFV
ncbi:MAG: 4-hydroxythreonine-4-phosphate dehydrogenase PdxA [Candidatus Gastranaerophilales bacterium]|nr:4-hydroxythreonine-4-phosphate dehydrogenase PdxA [Candidatus Gastranaerophilales bacterium]